MLLCLYNILMCIFIVGRVSPPDSGKSEETMTTGMIVGISVACNCGVGCCCLSITEVSVGDLPHIDE
jgi:hypothetical protein